MLLHLSVSRFLQFKFVVSFFVLIFFSAGAYFGYLSALVDLDEQEFLRQIQESTDKERLQKQLARTKSILEARSRAYVRRSQDFIRQQQSISAAVEVPPPVLEEKTTVPQVNQILSAFEQQKVPLNQESKKVFTGLQEEQKDLAFFQDEVGVIEQTLAREVPQEDVNVYLASDRKKRSVSGGLQQLLLIIDKQKELTEKRKAAVDGYQYWEQNARAAPGGISIAVSNKDQLKRQLNPLHVTQITTALSVMPSGFDQRLRNVYIVYGDPKMRRGMTGVGVVFMKGEELDFFRVMVHEFGHVWDLTRETSDGPKSNFNDGEYRIYESDPSATYYSYSWKSTTERSSGAQGYASSYGMSDPFEDFAEAFSLYVMQQDTFKNWAGSNPVMAKKYAFISQLYNGRSFASSKKYLTQPYDVTMLYVDYNQLLESGG